MLKKISTYVALLVFIMGFSLIYMGTSFSYDIEKTDNLYEDEEFVTKKNGVKEINDSDQIVNINLSFIGDSLIASFKGEKYSSNFQDLLDNNDYSYPYKNVFHIFKDDDFTIANGENVFTDKNLIPIEKNYSPAYWYYSKQRFANVYKESSIEVVSVMNNHAYDYGTIGYLDTKQALTDASVIVGAEEAIILEKNGIKVGILCINLFHRFQYEEAILDIKKLTSHVDYIVVYFHGGIEYQYKPSSEIVEYSHGFIDNGADLVIGCHPHILEPIEIYKNKKIVYSLGSFLFGGTRTLVNRTIIYQMNLVFNKSKSIVVENDKIIPCYLYSSSDKNNYESWIPSIIENENEKQKVIDFMHNLVDSPI